MKVEIIKADYFNLEHENDIQNLLNEYALDSMGGSKALSKNVMNKVVKELAKLPYAFSFIAYVNTQAVGLVNCFESFSTFAAKPLINIHDIMVLKQFRGQGISQALLQAVEEAAISKDCCKITLEVLSGNEVAKSSYKKFGFSAYQLEPSNGSAMFWQKTLG